MPGRPRRAGSTGAVCLQLYQPGVNPLNVQTYLQVLAGAPGLLSVSLPDVNLVGAPGTVALNRRCAVTSWRPAADRPRPVADVSANRSC